MIIIPNCKLCNKNSANQLDSHIFPRFLGVSLLAVADNKRVSYTTENFELNSKPKVRQDSPKVSNILCDSCEKKIGVWERDFANEFYYPFINGEFQKNCDEIKKEFGIKVLTKSSSNYMNFKRVIYSMLLRASVSGHVVFANLLLKDRYRELLRQILNEEISFEDIPIFVMTCNSRLNADKNYIFATTL